MRHLDQMSSLLFSEDPKQKIDKILRYLMGQARVHLMYALVPSDPAAAVAGFLELCGPHPGEQTGDRDRRMPGSMIETTRRELFARLIEAGAYREARILLPGVVAALPAGSAIAKQLEASLGALTGNQGGARSGGIGLIRAVLFSTRRLRLRFALAHLARSPEGDLSRFRLWAASPRLALAALARRLRGS